MGRLYASRDDANGNSTVTHYVNGKEFYAEFKQFKIDNAERVAAGLRPIIPNSIAVKIMAICEKLSCRYNFVNYPFREEMVADAIQNCILYIWNFDVDKSDKIFSYFTITAHRAFVRRIQREARHQEIVDNYTQRRMIDNGIDDQPEDTGIEDDTLSNEIDTMLFGADALDLVDGPPTLFDEYPHE